MLILCVVGLFADVAALSGCASAPFETVKPSEGVFFIDLADGAKVTSPIEVKFGVTGKEVKPAVDATPNSGHHHLLVNLDTKPAGEVIPFDAVHIHYGKGQTEAEVKLPAGVYIMTWLKKWLARALMTSPKSMPRAIKKTNTDKLSTAIRNGGKGVWGATAMSANATVTDSELQTIATWLVSRTLK